MERPHRPLTPDELFKMKADRALERAENELDLAWQKEMEQPALWFGRLLGLGVVCLFLDVVGWVTAFLSPRLNYALNLFLKLSLTVAVVGCAGLAIWGLVKGYQHEKTKKQFRLNFVFEDKISSPDDRSLTDSEGNTCP